MFGIVVSVVTFGLILAWTLRLPPRLLGVYSRPGFWYWPKVLVFFLLVKLRRWQGSRHKDGEDAGYGVKSRASPELMDCVQPLSDHPKAIDAVYFNSGSENGHYVVAAAARRPHGVVNGVLYIRIPSLGVLQLPKTPDTMLFGEGKEFAAEGLRLSPVRAMREWRIQYEGPMKLRGEPLSSFDVHLDAKWTSEQPYFDFDTDMDAMALARSMAREPWSRQYFEDLKAAHQTHYEQMGRIEGTVVVDGHAYILRLDSMRDHSYGHKREWKHIHRYGLHMITTEDKLQINVGIVCQPITCSQLELGYVSDGRQVFPVTSVDLPLWQHGEGGHPPTDYAFAFTAGNKEYMVEVSVVDSPQFYIGWEWESRVVERFATFKVNGRRGWGIAEWQYRYKGGRPYSYSSRDPAWASELIKG
ncbi:uncharacterized protein LOC119575111 [Penaeus monodon]|uniref:uncharacterized protein LOC119575111 n=1 Tax=Penaeus monodon TaxID=6687 RepID=UPI0018A72911|nr:uncharacterized protein LOC119575111 [Penaeus monodon]XP_037778460.1 uncharacterized protein LOC119575111 [Penaeus monodon]